MADIEFLDEQPRPGEDENLPQPPRRELPGSPRGRRIAAVLAAGVLIGGALLARAATGPDPLPKAAPAPASASTTPSSAPTVRPSTGADRAPVLHIPALPTETVCTISAQVRAGHLGAGTRSNVTIFPIPDVGARHISVTVEPGGRPQPAAQVCVVNMPTSCPEGDDGQWACSVTGEVPAAVVHAVQQRYPGATFVSATSQITQQTHQIWYRTVMLRQVRDGRTVMVRVIVEQAGEDAGDSQEIDDGVRDVLRGVHKAAQTSTVVQVTAPSGSHQDLNVAVALAADPRLTAVG